jgi:hypothetical protein
LLNGKGGDASWAVMVVLPMLALIGGKQSNLALLNSNIAHKKSLDEIEAE